MVSSRMLAPLIVLLISSGALSNGELKCAYKDVPMVCQRVKSAYHENIKVAQQLTEKRFNDVKQRISDSNQAILVAIRTAEQGELFMVLHRALYREVNVMFHLKLSCSGEKSKTPECEAGFRGLSNVIHNLVYAMWDIADEKKSEAIRKTYDSFQKDVRDRNKSVLDQAYYLGIAVTTAIGKLLIK